MFTLILASQLIVLRADTRDGSPNSLRGVVQGQVFYSQHSQQQDMRSKVLLCCCGLPAALRQQWRSGCCTLQNAR